MGERMHSTLNSLEACAANVKNFALESDDDQARRMFSQYGQQLDGIVQGMRGRINRIESKEPQYQVHQQNMRNRQE
ncbi:MAG: DUF1657 domain-containing protein [Peptococcaceae bacterium]|nr:DUF1657 domain-containing protein [Peptococcaceae bacterium]